MSNRAQSNKSKSDTKEVEPKPERAQKGVYPSWFKQAADEAAANPDKIQPRNYDYYKANLLINPSKIKQDLRSNSYNENSNKPIRVSPSAVIYLTGVRQEFRKEILSRADAFKPKPTVETIDGVDKITNHMLSGQHIANALVDPTNEILYEFSPNIIKTINNAKNKTQFFKHHIKSEEEMDLEEKAKKARVIRRTTRKEEIKLLEIKKEENKNKAAKKKRLEEKEAKRLVALEKKKSKSKKNSKKNKKKSGSSTNKKRKSSSKKEESSDEEEEDDEDNDSDDTESEVEDEPKKKVSNKNKSKKSASTKSSNKKQKIKSSK